MANAKPRKSQMPSSARHPVRQPPPNMNEKHVDAAQRQQAMEFLQKIMMAKGAGPQYMPIIKALSTIGVEPKVMDVMLGDEPEECLVIPLTELMSKEWRYMSEMETIKENL